MKNTTSATAPESAVAKMPGPNPPYHALTTAAAMNHRNVGRSLCTSGSVSSLAAAASTTAPPATAYRAVGER